MGRLRQFFIAPGPEGTPLPTAPSPWHWDRFAKFPMEHWDAVLDFAETIDAEKTETLRRYSCTPDEGTLPPRDELQEMLNFIQRLERAISESPPLVPEANELFPENYPNFEHSNMLEAVAAVLSESQRLHEPFKADADT